MAKLYIPTIMRRSVDGNATLNLDGTTVAAVFDQLVQAYPQVRDQLLDATGHVRRHINVFVNDEDIRFLDGEATALDARDEVTVLPAMAGGA
jgi:molybdopterin converting factor small subunit